MLYIAFDMRKRNLPASGPVSGPAPFATITADVQATIAAAMNDVKTALNAVQQSVTPETQVQNISKSLNDIYNALKSLLP